MIGVDLVKPKHVLDAAYDDPLQVTAAFNRNLLRRLNALLGTDADVADFAHLAFYDEALQRIEMHLVSRCRQSIALAGESFELAQGDSIHTENSHKFTVDSLRALAARAGFKPGPVWTDPQGLFSVHWLHAPT